MKEIWKDIKGYEGLYQVSNLGRVKSLERTRQMPNCIQTIPEKIKNINDNGYGYKIVNLWKENKGKTLYIHRLVAEAFIGEIKEGYAVNHKDFNKENNIVTNLEIVTYKDNNLHSSKAGRYANKGGKVIKVIYNDGTIEEYPSVTQASKSIDIHRDTIVKFINHGGSHGKKKFKELNIKTITQE